MLTVLYDGPYSFIFFSSDKGEPAHIHVKRDRQVAKFWLTPISLASYYSGSLFSNLDWNADCYRCSRMFTDFHKKSVNIR